MMSLVKQTWSPSAADWTAGGWTSSDDCTAAADWTAGGCASSDDWTVAADWTAGGWTSTDDVVAWVAPPGPIATALGFGVAAHATALGFGAAVCAVVWASGPSGP